MDFWATVYKMVCPYAMGPLSCLSVTLVYCGQTVGWITIPLGTELGLSPGDIVLDGDPVPPWKGAQQRPHFSPHVILAHVYCGQTVAHFRNCRAAFTLRLGSKSVI